MSDTRERAGAAGVVVAGTFFKIVLYICVIVLLFWVGKASYQFGHDVFNQQAMSPGEGQEVTVVIKEDTSLYKIAKTLQKKGLVKSATVFYVQERLSTYHGKLQAGTYLLSTAYTPNRIMGILAGDDEHKIPLHSCFHMQHKLMSDHSPLQFPDPKGLNF